MSLGVWTPLPPVPHGLGKLLFISTLGMSFPDEACGTVKRPCKLQKVSGLESCVNSTVQAVRTWWETLQGGEGPA